MNTENSNLVNIGVDINIPISSAIYLALALSIPIILFFISKKYIK